METFLEEHLRTDKNCPACGVLFDLDPDLSSGREDSPSIDRVHPELGYVAGNLALICYHCNSMKRDATPKQLESLVRWLRSVW